MNLDHGATRRAEPGLSVSGPGELLACIPYFLGFRPDESLVLVGAGPGSSRVMFTLRVDLPAPRAPRDVLRAIAETAAAQGCAGLVIAMIGGPPPKFTGTPPKLLRRLRNACGELGIRVAEVLWVAKLVPGERWCRLGDPPLSGLLPDPRSSPAAVAAVASGQVTYRDREELERLVAPGDPVVLRRRAALINDRIDRAIEEGDARPPLPAIRLLDRWMETAARETPTFTDDEVAELCLALADPLVRDAALGFAAYRDPDAAQRLWAALVTEAPDPEAAEPAVLLAHSALVNKQYALIGVALERARQAFPDHHLSTMFRAAMVAGLGPEELMELFDEGAKRAAVLLTGLQADQN